MSKIRTEYEGGGMIMSDLRYQYFRQQVAKYCRDEIPYITEQCWEAMFHYLVNGLDPGAFLTNLLSNDLWGAVYSADFMNKKNISSYVKLVTHVFPKACYGTDETFTRWMQLSDRERERILLQLKLIPDVFELIKLNAEQSS